MDIFIKLLNPVGLIATRSWVYLDLYLNYSLNLYIHTVQYYHELFNFIISIASAAVLLIHFNLYFTIWQIFEISYARAILTGRKSYI